MNRLYVLLLSLFGLNVLGICMVQEAPKLKKLKPTKYEIVDTTKLAMIYEHQTYDPVLDKTKSADKMLSIGDKYSMYRSYGNYKLDSLFFVIWKLWLHSNGCFDKTCNGVLQCDHLIS